ncbi:MAG: hypothetical protein JKY50_22610 [Oleispira sp.]|nr:hypothetical protein [Oleispira sp.]
MNEDNAITLIMAIWILWSVRRMWITDFKIAYYEQKLKNRGVDIGHIENINLNGIRKI